MTEWMNWGFWVDTLLGGAHFAAALIALILGPIVLFRRKGDIPHRWLGRIWVVAMLIVNIVALSMYDLHGRPNLFHFFAVLSLVTLIPGFLSIRKYKRTRERKYLVSHQHFMVWAYFGLAAAGVWQIAFKLVFGLKLNIGPGLLYNGLGALTGIVAVSLFLFLRKKYPDAPKKAAK